MNLRESLDAGPAKAAGIFQTLSDTSNGAVKTREKLFDALKAELEAYGDLLERQLLPALKQHEKTRALVPDTLKAIKEFRGKLAELDALAKDDEAFIPRLKELRKAFHEIVRSEQKDLVPSVLRAASEEQAAREQAETEKAQAQKEREQAALQKAADETARKAAALKAAERASKAAEKKAAERAAQKAAEKETVEKSRKAAERKAVREARKAAEQKAAEQAQKAAEQKAAQRARKAAERRAAEKQALKAAERKTARSAQQAVETKAARAQKRALEQNVVGPLVRQNGADPRPDFNALAAFSKAATRGVTEMGSAWMEFLGGSGSIHAQLSRQLLACRTMQDLARTQQRFLAGSAQGWMEHNQRVLQISRHAAEEGMRALGGRRPGPGGQ